MNGYPPQYDPFAATNAGTPQAQQPPMDPFMASNMGQAQPSWPMQPPMRQMGPGQAPGQPGQSAIDPATAAQLLALNQTGAKQAQANRQLRLAEALRNAAPGMARSQSPINTPNWAGAIGGVLSGLRARQLEGQAEATEKDIGTQRESAYKKIIEQLTGQRLE